MIVVCVVNWKCHSGMVLYIDSCIEVVRTRRCYSVLYIIFWYSRYAQSRDVPKTYTLRVNIELTTETSD